MSPEKTKKLVEDYPNIFSQDFYFECDDGWYNLICALCGSIKTHIEYNVKDKKVTATQVKEKFGTLRFYVEGGDDYTDGMITMAESMSAYICEGCGNKGAIRNGGWVRTHCDPCEQEYQEKKLGRLPKL